MIFDNIEMFGDNQDLSQIVGNYLFDHSIDTGVAGTPVIGGPLAHNFGFANEKRIVAVVDEAFLSAGAATVQLQVVEADDAALTSNLQVIRETRAITYSDLTLGVTIDMGEVPPMTKRYLGLRGVIGGATTTAGTLTAGLSDAVANNAMHALR